MEVVATTGYNTNSSKNAGTTFSDQEVVTILTNYIFGSSQAAATTEIADIAADTEKRTGFSKLQDFNNNKQQHDNNNNNIGVIVVLLVVCLLLVGSGFL